MLYFYCCEAWKEGDFHGKCDGFIEKSQTIKGKEEYEQLREEVIRTAQEKLEKGNSSFAYSWSVNKKDIIITALNPL